MEFTVFQDPDGGYIVAENIGAYSFAIVPAGQHWFSTADEATAKAQELTGQSVETFMLETPERFEAVADTKYGPAWC